MGENVPLWGRKLSFYKISQILRENWSLWEKMSYIGEKTGLSGKQWPISGEKAGIFRPKYHLFGKKQEFLEEDVIDLGNS